MEEMGEEEAEEGGEEDTDEEGDKTKGSGSQLMSAITILLSSNEVLLLGDTRKGRDEWDEE